MTFDSHNRSSQVDDSNLLVEVKDLKTYFYLDEGMVRTVDGPQFDIYRG